MISVLLLDPNDNRIGHLICYLPIAKVKDYNVTIEGKKKLQLVKEMITQLVVC